MYKCLVLTIRPALSLACIFKKRERAFKFNGRGFFYGRGVGGSGLGAWLIGGVGIFIMQ